MDIKGAKITIDAKALCLLFGRFTQRDFAMSKVLINLKGKTAAEILRQCDQENSVPVDLNAILRRLDISAKKLDFTKIESILRENGSIGEENRVLGAAITSNGRRAIFYSSDDTLMSNHRYRFTVAHELGHLCQGEDNHIEFRFDIKSDSKKERDANIFAGELLIPLHQLERISNELYFPTIKNLAAVFKVSINVMEERLRFLDRPDLFLKSHI